MGRLGRRRQLAGGGGEGATGEAGAVGGRSRDLGPARGERGGSGAASESGRDGAEGHGSAADRERAGTGRRSRGGYGVGAAAWRGAELGRLRTRGGVQGDFRAAVADCGSSGGGGVEPLAAVWKRAGAAGGRRRTWARAPGSAAA